MRSKKKSMEQLTSALMAIMMAVSTTISPVMTLASEIESLSAIESQTIEEKVIAEEFSSIDVQAESRASSCEEDATKESSGLEASSSIENESVSDEQESESDVIENEVTMIVETTTEVTCEKEEETLSIPTESFEKITEESSANEPRAPDEEPTKTAEEDQLAQKFGFDYNAASDFEVCEYLYGLSEEKLAELVEAMTSEQYLRYLSIKEMMEEMNEKEFSDVIDETNFTADRVWDYASYDAFAEALTGISLQRTDQIVQFYNTYVDPSQVQAGVTTIDGLLNSNTDWYSNDYILGLNPEMFKETVPVYYGSDGNYYVVSMVPTLNSAESADYQPATNFYNGSVEAQAFTDIEYLGNGVYRIPNSRYQYCFTEQYVSDMGTLYGISFGLRIQVLYGFTPSGEVTIAADVLYPDMTERLLPATLNLLAGTATVKIFNDEYEDCVDKYLVSASINRGASLPESMGSKDNGKTIQFVVNDASAVGSLDILLGYNAISKYSMAAQVTTAELYSNSNIDTTVSRAAQLYRGQYLKLANGSVPKNLKVGDKFIYANTGLTIVGVETSHDLSYGKNPDDPNQGIHVGAKTIPTHDAQSFCFYNGKGDTALDEVKSWFRTKLNTTSADPGYMVQMTEANISARASWNGTSVNLGGNKIFGYMTDGLGTAKDANGNTLNLEGTNVLLSCMHAWGNESATTPQDILDSISSFTGRTQKDFAADTGFGHYKPNIALQCTSIEENADGYTYATFKVLTSMLKVGGVINAQNYQCAFSTLRIAYENPKTGYIKVHKTSANPKISNGNGCYTFKGIQYGIYSDSACKTKVAAVTLDEKGTSTSDELAVGTYYIKETSVGTNTGYKLSDTVYKIDVTAGATSDSPVICETTDAPLYDPFGIVINKINSDGSTKADLSGAEYTIKFYAGQYDTVAKLPAKATYIWRIKTVKEIDGKYRAMLDDTHIVSGTDVYGKSATGMYAIPLGTITVEETKAPTGFTVNGATVTNAKTNKVVSGTNNVYLFRLVDEKSSVYIKNGNVLSTEVMDKTAMTFTYSENVIRGDLTFTKKSADNNSALAYIPFKITNNETGETHYIITDANGNFNSANGKTKNTNANDKVLSKYEPKDIIPQSVINSLIKNAGLWFGFGSENTMTTANDSYGALVYGTYTITEMKTQATKSMTMISKTITIQQDAQIVRLGDLLNVSVKIRTTFTDDADNDHYAKADSTVNFTDVIEYQNLPIGKLYTIKATLYVKDGPTLTKHIEKTATFQPTSKNGTTKVQFNNISTKGLAGKTLVCYEELTCDGEFIAEHKNPNDEGQTVHFPTIHTTAVAQSTGDHVAQATKSLKITDTVTMTSLCVGDTYKIAATLMDKASGRALKVNGADVVVTKSFIANNTTMQVPVDFVIDASTLAGITTVAFETLSFGKTVIATHEDIDDQDQTVYLPSIKTNAKDAESKTNYVAPKENAEIIDNVRYSNLLPGKKYKITGKLMSKKTGQVVTVKGQEITVTQTFTASESGNGTIEMRFKFDATDLTGAFVVFEAISYNDVIVAEHEDINDTDQTVYFSKLTVLKLSQDDEYVVGAKLEIRDSKGTVVEAFESKENGNVFYRLAFDTEYMLIETEAPEGFFVADSIPFELKENGRILVNGEELDELIMIDKPSKGYLEVTKESIVSKKLLSDAVYGVYSDEICTTLVTTLETDRNGTASVLLEHGQYWVKELKAPQGYRFDYTVYGPYKIEGGQTTSTILYDVPISPVPTGIIMTFWPYLVALGVGTAVLIGSLVIKKYKKKN